MKYIKFLFITIALIINIDNIYSQECGSDLLMQSLRDSDPSTSQLEDSFTNNLLFLQQNSYKNDANEGVFIIPVVIHLIGTDICNDYLASNYQKINDQITVLNQCYRKIPGGPGYGNGVDTRIEFCLATIDPNGEVTNGITHTFDINGQKFPEYDPRLSISSTAHNSDYALKSLIHWPPEKYLNIYIAELETGFNGYAYLSEIMAYPQYIAQDGLVLDPDVVAGSNTIPTRNQGLTAVHEIGHWLNLYHPWGKIPISKGGGHCNDDDDVSDTPFCSQRYWSSYPNGCPTLYQCQLQNNVTDRRQIENFMDYSDDGCRNMFTQGQKDRMRLTLSTIRSSLFSNNNVTDIGCYPDHCSDNIQNADETGVDCGGLDCVPCLDGYGGGTTPCTGGHYSTQNGFIINNKPNNKPAGLCLGNPIVIAPVTMGNNCEDKPGRFFFKVESRESSLVGEGCNNLNNLSPYHCTANLWKCFCRYYYLYIEITECDVNLSPIGSVYGSWMPFQYAHGHYFPLSGQNNPYGMPYINWFDLNNHLPSPNITFSSGKYYKIRIATQKNNNSYLYESTNYIHFWEDDPHYNGITHTQDIKGKNITLENATIQQEISVIGSNSITVLPNSQLDRGLYTINSSMNCYNFKKGSSNGNSNGSSNNNSDNSSNHFDDFTETDDQVSNTSQFSIYPNPNNGVFKISFEDSDYKNFEIKITDLQGRLIKQISNLNTSVQEMTIPGGTKGVYIIQIIDKTTQEITFGKVIIQ
jgi:hypothetical protein